MFDIQYDGLNDIEKLNFKKCANMLLSRTYIIKYKYASNSKNSIISQEYKFIERYFTLFRTYFDYMGWEIKCDTKFEVIYINSAEYARREKFDTLTSMILIVLRLIYDEGREKLVLRREVNTNVKEIIDKLLVVGAIADKPPNKEIVGGLRTLKKQNLVEKRSGEWSDPTTDIIIYPSIIFMVNEALLDSIICNVEEREESNEIS